MKASSASNPKDGSDKKTNTDWMKNISPNKVISDAQRILKTAVDVLEEEIAAGIVAAKKLEKKVINVDELRRDDPEQLMSRIRRDVHDAVDIFLDAVTALTNHFPGLTEAISRPKETANGKDAGNGIVVIKNEEKANAGQTIELSMLLTNKSDKPKVVTLSKADLINAQGKKILLKNITVEPPSFSLAPLEKKEVHIKVRIPISCKTGVYSGLFQDSVDLNLRAIVTVEVE